LGSSAVAEADSPNRDAAALIAANVRRLRSDGENNALIFAFGLLFVLCVPFREQSCFLLLCQSNFPFVVGRTGFCPTAGIPNGFFQRAIGQTV
jgi:hypothetical protein